MAYTWFVNNTSRNAYAPGSPPLMRIKLKFFFNRVKKRMHLRFKFHRNSHVFLAIRITDNTITE